MPMAPRVSVVTVTQDRRRFLPHLISTIEKQTIPKSELEWILFDDGHDPVGDLVKHISYARYFYSSERMKLGYKRNVANFLCRGEYLFYFDDDNYAFPHRLEVGLEAFERHANAAIVGSSDMFVYDASLRAAYVCGPFASNHATLGTWGVRRSFFTQARFDEAASKGEEVAFTRDWTVPILQLGRANTSVCFDHGRNTISKRHLAMQASELLRLEDIIQDADSRAFLQSF